MARITGLGHTHGLSSIRNRQLLSCRCQMGAIHGDGNSHNPRDHAVRPAECSLFQAHACLAKEVAHSRPCGAEHPANVSRSRLWTEKQRYSFALVSRRRLRWMRSSKKIVKNGECMTKIMFRTLHSPARVMKRAVRSWKSSSGGANLKDVQDLVAGARRHQTIADGYTEADIGSAGMLWGPINIIT